MWNKLDIIENIETGASYVIDDITHTAFRLVSTTDSANVKTEEALDTYVKIGESVSVDGRYRKFAVTPPISEVSSNTTEWDPSFEIYPNFTYGHFLDLVKDRNWDVLSEQLSTINTQVESYDVHHNLNPLAIYHDLQMGKPGMSLVKEYEQNVWGHHKDSDMYSFNRTPSGQDQPFEIEPSKVVDTDAYATVLQAKVGLDIEMDNSIAGGHGSIAPCDGFETNTGPSVRKQKNIRSPYLVKENSVKCVDKIGYSVKDATTNRRFFFATFLSKVSLFESNEALNYSEVVNLSDCKEEVIESFKAKQASIGSGEEGVLFEVEVPLEKVGKYGCTDFVKFTIPTVTVQECIVSQELIKN